jgi:hypothetical protein
VEWGISNLTSRLPSHVVDYQGTLDSDTQDYSDSSDLDLGILVSQRAVGACPSYPSFHRLAGSCSFPSVEPNSVC